MLPDSTLRRPVIAWISSDWPFPSIPAIPTISPARTSKERFFTAGTPRFSLTTRSLIDKTTSFGWAACLAVLKDTERPTIISAKSALVAPAISTVSIDFPRRITVTRSETARISSNLWVIKMMDLPSLTRFFIMAINSSISEGVNTAVGSSKIRISAPR